MANYIRFAALLLLASLYATLAPAQQDTPTPQTDSEQATEPVQPDQEVEVNEDNYRQFMELRDGLQQRTIAPQDSFESRSGLQKLDQLPEASQKHLRDQLREIISRGDRWQPGDENADYPYVPSEGARANAKLQSQEAEAWGELVDNYHAREAQIHANSARSSAALASSGAAMGNEQGESGEEGENRSDQGQQGSEQSASQPGSEAGSFSPGAQGGADAQKAEGVAQNAMEFLQNAGYQGGKSSEAGSRQQAGDSGQMSGQAQQGGQEGTAQASAQSQTANPGAQDASQSQESDGSEQNAMQYLQQLGQQDDAGESGDQQSGDSDETSPTESQEATIVMDAQGLTTSAASGISGEAPAEGVSQNALEYLSGEDSSVGDAPADTLSIEDLLQAQGVAIGVGADSPPDSDEPPKDPPD